MENLQLNDFYNDGFGWICKPCGRELEKEGKVSDVKLSRLMSEGEAESKQPKLSVLALAKWADKTNQTLMCPRCGITEPVDKF
jgi:ribosomal protein L37AE/L43A